MIKTLTKKWIDKYTALKIRTQFFLVLICAGIMSVALFQFMWSNKWNLWLTLKNTNVFSWYTVDDNFFSKLSKEAGKYNVPKNEEDTDALKAFQPFLDQADPYTSLYVYGLVDGIFRASKSSEFLNKSSLRRSLFDFGYQVTDGAGEEYFSLPVKFKNGYETVIIYHYHATQFIYPYYFFCFFTSLICFIFIVLFFINRKMNSVICIEQDVLRMASGDLNHAIFCRGGGEIGILAKELDNLRLTLQENIEKEQESRQANSDLITALSHDLRTPLTILNGYLEVIHLSKSPEQTDLYLKRCLQKTQDIKAMTDRMFEYALVSEEQEIPEFSWISTDFSIQCLKENCDFLRLAGFSPQLTLPETTGILYSDKSMQKRIFNNLFSNILKYGDKKSPVLVCAKIRQQTFSISVKNAVKPENSYTESSHIGLKNVEKLIALLNGHVQVEIKDPWFSAEIQLPLK